MDRARVGDTTRAFDTLAAAVSPGFAAPRALTHPWLEPLRGDRFDALRAEAEAARAEAERAFRDAGGPALLGV